MHFSTSQLPKVVRDRQFFTFLTSKCASRHSDVHFFDITTCKSAPNPSALTHLTWKCASRHNGVIFLTSQLLKVLRSWGALYILTWKCASRHNGVQLLISHLASWLRTRRFSEPTFRPNWATNHWKNTMNCDFPTFSRTCIFFLLTLSLLCSSHFLASPLWFFPPLLFHLPIVSEVWLLNFLRTWFDSRLELWFAFPIVRWFPMTHRFWNGLKPKTR